MSVPKVPDSCLNIFTVESVMEKELLLEHLDFHIHHSKAVRATAISYIQTRTFTFDFQNKMIL